MRKLYPLEVFIFIAALVLYAAHTYHFYFLSDDSFISFRYARHLAMGYGLVWNPGQYVEGYTNPLWTVLMAAVIKLGLSPELWSNAIGILAGVALLLLLSYIAYKRLRTSYLWLMPLTLCAASRSYSAWSTSGLETMLFALLLFAASVTLLQALEKQTLPKLSIPLFALLCFCRPEGLLYTFVGFCFLLSAYVRKQLSGKQVLHWVAPIFICIAAHFTWRYNYYGELLPNTFFAKVPGLWLSQGMTYLGLFHSDYQLGWFLPFVFALPLIRRDISSLYISVVVILQIAYVVSIGGDRFEFRFLVPFLPFYFLIIAGTLDEFLLRFNKNSSYTFVVVIIWVALLGFSLYGSHKKSARKQRHGIASIEGIKRYATSRAIEGKFLRRLVRKKLLPKDTTICVGGAGALPYYSRLPTIDRRGLSDHHIARVPITKRGIIAHERDAPIEYLREKKVVMFDALNRLVHKKLKPKYVGGTIAHDLEILKLRTFEVDKRYLIFAQVLEDEEIAPYFDKLKEVKQP